ncbi:lipoprotein-releasing ABC transporter permease subunit [Paracraurococcus ruber]|uniref:Lipoprotein-releasing system transmembrane subunit LolC n=1 Tax=Paracraurococcus ruber TaxID=77675 RepID=A0ABS1CQL9_9PROT|nr:lipoprotein-releasing ABC transporter permease subunit [Paracraurococcus ruber]MBK1656724.1 lipoprotein-releasing system transmembrane subunit LolC [Paracraurococcus ruber]TDG31987.1 lipoprotein-releasing ABC transporter permease subunit [Paracraurococcus ruber]
MAEGRAFGPFERAIAGRYLLARKGERFVSVIAGFSLVGIALGVGTLIVVLSVMGGFRQELLGRILGLNGHLGVTAAQGLLTDYAPLAARLRALPAVAQAAPVVEGQVLLTTDAGGSAGGLLRGIAPEDLRARALVAGNIKAGSLDAFQGEDAIVIGTGLARRLEIGIGDRLTVVSPQGRVTVFGTVPRLRAYRVAALFEVGMQEYDGGFVFLPLAAAQLFFQMPNAVSQVEVFLQDPGRSGDAAYEIRRALADRPVRIADWQDANSGFFEIVQVQRNVMFLILMLIILVAAFNIISSLTMLVKDKGRDIAILRTMGAGRGAILRIFLLCGAAVGGVGTLAGLGLGLLFCANIESIRQALMQATGTTVFDPEIYFLTQIPAVVDAAEVAQVVGLALLLSLLATLLPSWRAAWLDPVEALRNE